MEDCDWADLPSTSSAVLTIDENNITDSSPEISEKREDLVLERETDHDGATANESKNDIDIKSKKVSLKEKKEKDSCPICLSSYDDRSFLDQCFHILFMNLYNLYYMYKITCTLAMMTG